ncbi:hypothetical protein Tco_0539671, partial [Tanacetum coccineum]
STPMDTSEMLISNNAQAVSQLEYSRVIDCLIYAMTCTWPDIAFDVGKLSRQSVYQWLGIHAWWWCNFLGYQETKHASRSTMEYEFVALAAAGKEAESLKNFSLRFHYGPNL